MNSTQACKEVRKALMAALAGGSYDLPVLESSQPAKQGRVDDGIYYHSSNPKNVGWQKRRYSVDDSKISNEQHFELTIQFTCFVDDDVARGYSSQDLASIVQMHMQTMAVIHALKAVRIGVQRPSPIRTLRFVDERQNYAVESSFDVVVTYTTDLEQAQAIATLLDGEASRL